MKNLPIGVPCVMVALAKRIGRVALLAAAFAVLASGVAFGSPTNLLVNPGFETGSFSGWTVSGTSPNSGVATSGTVITGTYPGFGTTTVTVHSGTYAGYAVVCSVFFPCVPSGHTTADYLALSQTVSLVGGALDTASFWLASGSGTVYGNSSEILVDGLPIALTSRPAVSSTYALVSTGTFTTTGGAHTIEFYIDGSGFGDAGFSFDDFSLDTSALAPIPEPGTMMLFGSGLLLFGGILRRHLLA